MPRKRQDLSAPAGRQRVTLIDICRAAGVSKATVSNVVNNKPGVGPETREKIRNIIRKMGYVPKPAARHLSLARTDAIACVFQDITPGWLLTVYRAILSKASENGFHVITALSARYGDELELPTHVLGTASVDGLLWMDPRVTPELVNRFKNAQPMPFVLLQGHVNDPDITTVGIENVESAYQAVRHLLSLGYRRFMLLTGPDDNMDSHERLAGARKALEESKVKVPPEYVVNGHNFRLFTFDAMKAFEKAGRPWPEAIFAFNDDMALGAYDFLKERGLRVPEDVAIVGFDGTEEAIHAGLTTVETPMREVGMLGTQLLVDLIRKPPEERKGQDVKISGRLRIGTTCGAQLRRPAKG